MKIKIGVLLLACLCSIGVYAQGLGGGIYGPTSVPASGGAFTGPVGFIDGSLGAPSIYRSSNTLHGWHFTSAPAAIWGDGTNNLVAMGGGLAIGSGGTYGFSSTADATATADVKLSRVAANKLGWGGSGVAAITHDYSGLSATRIVTWPDVAFTVAGRNLTELSNGAVGIGVSPGAPLDVYMTANASAVMARVQDTSGFGTYNSYGSTFNFNGGQDANTTGYLNFVGYNNSTTRFRNLEVDDGKQTVVGFFDGVNHRFGVANAAPAQALDVTGSIATSGSVILSTDTFIGRKAAANIQLGVDSATPIAQTISGAGAVGSNLAGGDLILLPGAGTGSGQSGVMQIKTSFPGGGASTQNTYYPALTIMESTNSQPSNGMYLTRSGIIGTTAGSGANINLAIGGATVQYTFTATAARPNTDNAVDLGTTTQRWRTTYTATAVVQKVGTGLATAATIAPVNPIVHITDAAITIVTITPPTGCATTGNGCVITLIPDAAFTTNATGNIALASTAVINRALVITYDNATSKWYPSY